MEVGGGRREQCGAVFALWTERGVVGVGVRGASYDAARCATPAAPPEPLSSRLASARDALGGEGYSRVVVAEGMGDLHEPAVRGEVHVHVAQRCVCLVVDDK